MFSQDAFWLYTLEVLELEFKSLERHFIYPNLQNVVAIRDDKKILGSERIGTCGELCNPLWGATIIFTH